MVFDETVQPGAELEESAPELTEAQQLNALQQYFAETDIENLTAKVYPSQRFVAIGVPFTIKALKRKVLDEIRDKARKISKKDEDLYAKIFNFEVVAAACIVPDYKSADFIEKNNCKTAQQAIEKTLLPGEQDTMSMHICELSGYTINGGLESLKDKAKN